VDIVTSHPGFSIPDFVTFVSQLSAARNKKKLMWFVHVLNYQSLINLKFFYRGVTMAVSSSGTFI